MGCDWEDPSEKWLGFERPCDLFLKMEHPVGWDLEIELEAKHVRTIMSPSENIFFKQYGRQ